MGKALRVISGCIVIGSIASAWFFWPHLRVRIPDDFQKLSGPEREASARAARESGIRQKFEAAGVPYPAELFLRWLKRDASLELWARTAPGPFRMVTSYPILASSGVLGPKRREGDRQVPEGVYFIERFNPQSLYHLSLGLNYPNDADRLLSDPEHPGSDIYIHGKDVSIGCAPIGDAAIEELYVAALDARAGGQSRIPVHIFPARMSGPEWATVSAEESANRTELAGFWAQLAPVYEAFETKHIVPEVTVKNDGRYSLTAP